MLKVEAIPCCVWEEFIDRGIKHLQRGLIKTSKVGSVDNSFTLEQILELISLLENGAEILEINPDSLPLSEDLSVEEKINKLLKKNKHLNNVWQLRKNYSTH